MHLQRPIKMHLFLLDCMLTRVRRSCCTRPPEAVPSLLSNVIVSPYGDSNEIDDVAITSRSLLKLKTRSLFKIWGSIPRSYSAVI